MGDEELIELRLDDFFRGRMRRMIRKTKTHMAARARKPSTAMTAIAQCGNDEPPKPDWTFPGPFEGCAPAAEADADADAADEAEAMDKDEEEAMEEATESAKVVWTAEKVAWGISEPSKVLSLRVSTQ